MGKLYCIMGMSCTGKSTLYNSLIKMTDILDLKVLIQYTTRPIREGEIDGKDYNFCTKSTFETMVKENKIISPEYFDVIHNDKNVTWCYGTPSDFIADLDNHNYLLSTSIQTYLNLKDQVGETNIVPIFLYASDEIILQRMIDRVKEDKQSYSEIHNKTSKDKIDNKFRSKYKEYCRRFIADIDKYSLETADKLGIPEDLRFCSEGSIYFKVVDVIYKDMKK